MDAPGKTFYDNKATVTLINELQKLIQTNEDRQVYCISDDLHAIFIPLCLPGFDGMIPFLDYLGFFSKVEVMCMNR